MQGSNPRPGLLAYRAARKVIKLYANKNYQWKVIFIVYFERKYATQLRCPIPPYGQSKYPFAWNACQLW